MEPIWVKPLDLQLQEDRFHAKFGKQETRLQRNKLVFEHLNQIYIDHHAGLVALKQKQPKVPILIGRGTYAIVEWKDDKVLKTFKSEASEIEGQMKNVTDDRTFIREVITLFRYSHHGNIIRAFDFSIGNIFSIELESMHGDLYRLMELFQYFTILSFPAMSLTELLVHRALFAQESKVIDQITSAICYLHDNNVAHRDLKTSNILFKFPSNAKSWADIQIKVADLGLSRKFGIKTCANLGMDDAPISAARLDQDPKNWIFVPPEFHRSFVSTWGCASYDKQTDYWLMGILFLDILGFALEKTCPSKDIAAELFYKEPKIPKVGENAPPPETFFHYAYEVNYVIVHERLMKKLGNTFYQDIRQFLSDCLIIDPIARRKHVDQHLNKYSIENVQNNYLTKPWCPITNPGVVSMINSKFLNHLLMREFAYSRQKVKSKIWYFPCTNYHQQKQNSDCCKSIYGIVPETILCFAQNLLNQLNPLNDHHEIFGVCSLKGIPASRFLTVFSDTNVAATEVVIGSMCILFAMVFLDIRTTSFVLGFGDLICRIYATFKLDCKFDLVQNFLKLFINLAIAL